MFQPHVSREGLTLRCTVTAEVTLKRFQPRMYHHVFYKVRLPFERLPTERTHVFGVSFTGQLGPILVLHLHSHLCIRHDHLQVIPSLLVLNHTLNMRKSSMLFLSHFSSVACNVAIHWVNIVNQANHTFTWQ